MAALEPMKEKISHELEEALERLRSDIEKVEVWAGALSGFVQPIPEYQPECDRFGLPQADAGAQPETASEDQPPPPEA